MADAQAQRARSVYEYNDVRVTCWRWRRSTSGGGRSRRCSRNLMDEIGASLVAGDGI